MRLKLILAALLLSSGALAQEVEYIHPIPPDEAAKKTALLAAYELNGRSMVRWGMIDMADYVRELRSVDLTAPPAVKPVQTTQVKPTVEPKAVPADICAKNGMRKSIRGKSWRCVR